MARNAQLVGLGGRLVGATRTAPAYRLFDLDDCTGRPGMVRDEAGGAAVELEVWRLGAAAFGTFVGSVDAPLVIGTVELEDRTIVKGFLCEAYAVAEANEVTRFGGWRSYVTSA